MIHKVAVRDPVEFLLAHLQLDFRLLSDVLGVNNDDVRLVIHLFIKHIRNVQLQFAPQGFIIVFFKNLVYYIFF